MAGVATYLNLPGNTEEAFEFYKSVFGTEYVGEGIMRFSDAPGSEGIPDEMGPLVMHVGLPILGGYTAGMTEHHSFDNPTCPCHHC